MTRECPPELEARLFAAKDPANPRFASDIFEHLDVLREYASRCATVTEFGVRGANGSTIALLAGQPDSFIAYDINPESIISQPVLDLVGMAGRTKFQPRVGSTLDIIIEPTDLLFIDTWHVAKQLQAELERHADPVADTVRHYLCFHDTVSFRDVGEDGSEPGLVEVINWFIGKHAFPLWSVVEDRKNNNGLVILQNARERNP